VEIIKSMKNNILKKADLGTTIIIIIAIAAVINFLSYQIFYRWDLTRNKDYSISSVSKNAVAKLDDIVNIKVYFSKDLPSQYISLPQEVGDIIDEYVTYSKGKIQVEKISPNNDEATAQEMYMQGIPEIQFNVVEKDKLSIAKGYLGMIIKQGDKSEPIPVVQDTKNLEYQITMAIKKVTAKDLSSVGFLSGFETLDTEKDIKSAYQKLQELYDVQMIDLVKDKTIPEGIKTLIIAGPKAKFNDNQLKEIDKFLMKGNSLFVMLDSVNVGDGLVTTPVETGLEKLLEKYGLKINKNLVLDASSGMASFNQGFITFSTNYPFWPKIIKGGFDKDNAAVAKLETLVLPWASSIDVNKDKIDKSNKISIIAKTTDKAWQQTDNFNLNPQQSFSSDKKSQYNLGVSVFGKFNSAYGKESTSNGRIVLVGDSNFIEDMFLQNYPDNIIFFQNIVDSLTLDEDLINIRSKGISEAPIKELSDSVRATARYTNVFGITIIVLLFGLIRYYLRRKSKFVDEL